MAKWKRLHRTGEDKIIYVNLDMVVHMQGFEKHTLLHFVVSDGGHVHSLQVKETPEEIHQMPPTHSS